MDLFTTLQLLGWLAVGLVMFLFAATGGFDLGAGMLTPFLGKNDDQRRVIVNTVGPTWDGNQVWLITAGGAIFAIWPRVYAASFSGLYFGFLLVLWGLFLRPVAFEYRSKITHAKWRGFWDWSLALGSFIPALIIGVAVGNLFLGLPFQFDPESLRFYYGTGLTSAAAIHDLLGLLRPFALGTGVFCVVMMLMHGAAYLCLRTDGQVYDRCAKVLKTTSLLVIVLFAVLGVWLSQMTGLHYAPSNQPMLHPLTSNVTILTGGWLHNYALHPWMLSGPILGFLGALIAFFGAKAHQNVKAFTGSTISLFGILGTFGFSLFPFIMPSSTHPEQSLLAWNASSSEISLIGILVCAVIMLPIIFLYTHFVYRKMWGRGRRLSEEVVQQESHSLY